MFFGEQRHATSAHVLHRRIPRHLWNELKRGVQEQAFSLPPSIHAHRIASSQLAAVVVVAAAATGFGPLESTIRIDPISVHTMLPRNQPRKKGRQKAFSGTTSSLSTSSQFPSPPTSTSNQSGFWAMAPWSALASTQPCQPAEPP